MNLALRPATHEALERFRQRRQHLLQLRALLCAAVVALAAFTLIALLDRAWFMPDSVRPWLTLIVYAGAAYAAWRLAWRFIAQAKGKEGTAKLIEAAEPSLHERLLAAVELADPKGGVNVKDSVEFREKLQDDVAAAVEGMDWKSKLPTRTLKPWFMMAGGVALLILALCLIPGLHLSGFLARAALPFANLERPASVKIRVLEPVKANALAPIGSEVPLIIETDGKRPELATLELQTEGSKPRRSELSTVGATRFEGVVPVGQSDVRYRIHAGDAITPWRTLSARARPRITEFTKTIVPPAYTGAKEVQVTEDHGDLEALEGSTIKLTLKTNQPVTQSDVVLNPDAPSRKKSPATANAEGLLTADLAIKTEHASWQIDLKSQETSFTNEESTPWRITAIPDLPPTAQINEPAEQIELLPDESVRIAGITTDDVGLGSVKIAHAINGTNWSEREVPVTKGAKEAPAQSTIPLAPLGVKTGDTVMVKLVAIDLKGQKAESPPVRVIILDETVSPERMGWANQQRQLAQRAETLSKQTRELVKSLEQVRKTEKKDSKEPEKADTALAKAQSELEQVKEQSEALWNDVKEAAKNAPTQLDIAENRLLGEKLAHMRREALPRLDQLEKGDTENLEAMKRAARNAEADAASVSEAARAFATEETARITAQEADILQRQSKRLTENALQANRDAAQRPQWQEQQRALAAQTGLLKEMMGALNEVSRQRHEGQLKNMDKQVTETTNDLTASLDKPDQTKSPEHLYGASDNLRNRLQQTADVTRGIVENAANEAAQRREQLARQDNPALATLEEARQALAEAESVAKKPDKKQRSNERDGMTPAERAEQQLTEAAKQLQDQAELREQNMLTNNQGALDANRASRAVDQLAQNTQEAAKEASAEKFAKAKDQAAQLTQIARALEAEAAVQDAAAQLENSTRASDPGMKDIKPALDSNKAAALALLDLPNELNRSRMLDELRKTNPQAADQLRNLAQQTADAARNTAEQAKNLDREAMRAPPGQKPNVQPFTEASTQAAQKANELQQALAAQTDAAREQLAALTPQLSDMMKNVAADLKKTQEQTQTAANEAKAERPVAEVAEKAQDLKAESGENAEKMAALQAALRQEANAADLAQKPEAQVSRAADVALAQMQQKAPQIAQNLKQAAQATQSQPQAQNLQQAADAQQQTAQALEQLAQNMQKAEQGQQLTEAEQAAMQQLEQELGVQKPLDEAYQRAQELAEMAKNAQQNPQAVLEALEKELPKNPAMQKALADTAKNTAQQAEQAVAKETQQAVQNGMAQKQAANDLARVSRHQQRLGDKEAAQEVAQASNQLQQAGQQAEAQQANPQPNPQAAQQSQANAAKAAKAAEATASATSPAMMASPLEQLQGQMLAQALDQLDAQLHPMQSAQPSQNGQQQQAQGQQQGQQAQNSLNEAQQAQQQSMADSRNSGQTPGAKPSQQQTAQNQQQNQNTQAQSSEGGNKATLVQDGVLGQITVLVNGDWGHLPQKMADDLTEATRSEAAPEYRAAIESYYKAIANKAKR